MINEINYNINIRILGVLLFIGALILAVVTMNLFFVFCAIFCAPLTIEIEK